MSIKIRNKFKFLNKKIQVFIFSSKKFNENKSIINLFRLFQKFVEIFSREAGKTAADCEKYQEIIIAARYVLHLIELKSSKSDKEYSKVNDILQFGKQFTFEKLCLKRMTTAAIFDPNVTPHIDVSKPKTM